MNVKQKWFGRTFIAVLTIAAIAVVCFAAGGFEVSSAAALEHEATASPAQTAAAATPGSPDRFINGLSYPGDCKSSKLVAACKKNGCSTESGGSHIKCKKGGKTITVIPHTVKPNNTCRSIIKVINSNC